MMKLHEIIENILKEKKTPLSPLEIAKEIKLENIEEIDYLQIRETLVQETDFFQDINGRFVLVTDKKWKDLLTSYWYITNILRGSYRVSELPFIISALLFYKRLFDLHSFPQFPLKIKNVFFSQDEKENLSIKVYRALESLSEIDVDNNFPVRIFSELVHKIKKINVNKAYNLFSILENIDTTQFSIKEFGNAFEYFMEVDSSTKIKSGVIRTPHQIIELMVSILNPKAGSLYDPVCGTAGILTETFNRQIRNIELKGTEINYDVAQLAFMNMVMNGVYEANIQQKDCFNDLESIEYYDYIIGDLPNYKPDYNVIKTLANIWGLKLPLSKSFGTILLYIISKLSYRGKSVVTVADSFLTVSKDKYIRNFLIENDFIECVISLPIGSLLPYTNGKASILVLNKTKPSYLINKIKFINIQNESKTKNVNINSLQVINDCQNNIENQYVKIINIENVLKEDSLQPSYYTNNYKEIIKLLDEGKAHFLEDLVEISAGPFVSKDDLNNSNGIAYIKIENLRKDILDINLSQFKTDLFISDTLKSNKSLICEESIIIARIGDHLKPTFFIPNKNLPSILIHTNVYSLKLLKKHELSLEYLYYQLYSTFVQKQLELKRQGSVMPFISKNMLSKVVIPYMSLSAQEEYVSTQKSNIIASEKERVNQRLKAIGYEEESLKKESLIVRTLVHELRPKLQKMNTFTNKLLRIVKIHKVQNLKEYEAIDPIPEDLIGIIEKNENFSIEEVCEKLLTDSIQLSETLTTVKEVMSYSLKKSDFKKIDLRSFFIEYYETKKFDINDRYSFDIVGKNFYVYIHKESIKLVIDQLLSNAENHGFLIQSKKYRVQFKLKVDRERKIAIIEYKNNGELFSLSRNDYISAFHRSKKSRGSGIGGYHIYKIIKAHKGDIIIDESPKEGFFMSIEIPLEQEYEINEKNLTFDR